MSYASFPDNNGNNVSEDFLNLTLSLGTSSPVPASNAVPPLPASNATLPFQTLLSSSTTPPSSNTYDVDLTMYPTVGRWLHHQHTADGNPSDRQNTVVAGPSQNQLTTVVDPSDTVVGGLPYHQHTVVGGPSHQQRMEVEGPSHPESTEVAGLSHRQQTAAGSPPNRQGTAPPRGPSRNQPPASGGPVRNNIRGTRRILRPGQSETITPPYPWATDCRAIIHDLQYILFTGINSITGRVKCNECNRDFDIEYDLQTKFLEVQHFLIANKDAMCQRAPEVWKYPAQLDCPICNQRRCVKPILGKKRSINWLFLLLGQIIGFCKHTDLKYFCKHTGQHRTGAKDRVLYLTYLELCKQLDPQGDYDP